MSANNSKKMLWIIVAVVGALVILPLCCCGGCHYAINAGASQLMKEKFASDPLVVEHLGEVEKVKLNHAKTAELKKTLNREGAVFDVTGAKGSGEIVSIFNEEGTSSLESVHLHLPSGEEIDLLVRYREDSK